MKLMTIIIIIIFNIQIIAIFIRRVKRECISISQLYMTLINNLLYTAQHKHSHDPTKIGIKPSNIQKSLLYTPEGILFNLLISIISLISF